MFHVFKHKEYNRTEGENGPLQVVIDANVTAEQEVQAILEKARTPESILPGAVRRRSEN